MSRSLAVLVLSVVLTFGPVGLTSSLVQGAGRQNVQSQNANSSQAGDKSVHPMPDPASAPEGMKPEVNMSVAANRANGHGGNVKRDRRKARSASGSKGITQVQMRNVDFHVADSIILRVRNLRGALLRKNPALPPVFDDKQSFMIRIDSATVGIRTDSLAELMNNYVFAYPRAPLKELSVSTEENKIKLKGKAHKGVDIPFEITADLSATPEGKIQLHPTSIKAEGIPVKGLLHLFGLELDDLIKAGEARGVKIDDNDIILDPEMIIPPPGIRGKITAVRIEGDEVIQVFGTGNDVATASVNRSPAIHRQGANYLYFRGGTLRFGKLTMSNTDMRLVDRNPKDAFDFSIDGYSRQLVAGYSKITPRNGLVVFMPDYYKVRKTSSQRDASRAEVRR